MQPLTLAFYIRKTETIARELLGKYIVRRLTPNEELFAPPTKTLVARIVETEAYTQDEPASHAYRGLTTRNEVLFRRGGFAYVYRIYGLYDCMNVVTENEGFGSGVLLRAAEPIAGIEWMWAHRFPDRPFNAQYLRHLLSGPGKLCTGLGITRERYNGCSLLSGELTIRKNPTDPLPEIEVSPRIGINKARECLWRFTIAGNPYVSKITIKA